MPQHVLHAQVSAQTPPGLLTFTPVTLQLCYRDTLGKKTLPLTSPCLVLKSFTLRKEVRPWDVRGLGHGSLCSSPLPCPVLGTQAVPC